MRQNPRPRHPQRIPRRRTRPGTLACLFSVLLLGVVIARAGREDRPEEVVLHTEPARTASTASTASAAGSAGKGRAAPGPSRTPVLHPVARPRPMPHRTGAGTPAPVRRASRPENMIDGSPGDGGFLAPGGGPARNVTPTPLVGLERRYLRLINAERRRAGCRALRVDRRLTASARAHSTEMASSGYFHHNSPDGTTPWERMAAAGYRNGGAENIARGYRTAEEAVRGWLADQGHRSTILDCRLVATGVGVVAGEDGPWWTQDFGYS